MASLPRPNLHLRIMFSMTARDDRGSIFRTVSFGRIILSGPSRFL